MSNTVPGREAVGMEQELPQVADPREVAHYHTDLSDPNAVGKDLLNRGRESGLLAGYDGNRINTTHAGQAALASISSVPRPPSQIVYFKRINRDDFIVFENPGDKLQRVERKATEWDQRTYRHQWARYLVGQDQFAVGTPLKELYRNNPTREAKVKAANFHNVEQLSESEHEDAVSAQRLLEKKPIVDRDKQIADQAAEIVALKAQIEALQAQTRSRERPRL